MACIDTDTLNPTLLQYGPLKATHIRLSQNHVIDPRALDALVGIVTEAPANALVVVDVGSNGFETLMAYEVENGVFALLEELGHRVVVQTVIAGGPDAQETSKGVMALLDATDVPIILWLNEHLGPLEVQGQSIAKATFLQAAKDRFLGTILLPARTQATFCLSPQIVDRGEKVQVKINKKNNNNICADTFSKGRKFGGLLLFILLLLLTTVKRVCNAL